MATGKRTGRSASKPPIDKPGEAPGHQNDSQAAIDRQAAKEREAAIAEAAYFRSERRGFAPGHELEDWLAAEAEVNQRRKDRGRKSRRRKDSVS